MEDIKENSVNSRLKSGANDSTVGHVTLLEGNNDETLKLDILKSVTITPPAVSDRKFRQTKKNKDDDDWEFVPPDGNWGWVVLFGATLVNLLVPGMIKSFGVLLPVFREAFHAGESSSSLIASLCYFLYSSLGPLSSILSVKYSYRTVTLIGGTFAAVGLMLSTFANSIPYLCISYGIMMGTGAGLSFPPTVYIVTSYFVRLRGLANGICISGSAIGSIILPPLIRYLIVTYGYRGTVLILGGITLNTLVAGLFYQPVENHLKRVPKEPELIDDVIDEEDEGITLEFTQAPETIHEETNEKPSINITEDSPSTPKSQMTSPGSNKTQNGEFARSVSAIAVQNLSKSNHDDARQRKISTPVRGSHPIHNDSFVNQLSSTPSLYALPESRFSHASRLSRLNQYRSGSRPPKRNESTSSFQYVSSPFHGSTLSFQPETFASHLSLKSSSKTDDKTKKKFIDLTLLQDPLYLVILISNSTNAISYTNFIILLPSFAETLGIDKDMAAYLLCTVSALDLVGRIGGSALSDINLIPKTWYFVGGLLISGFSLSCLPMFTNYWVLSVVVAIFGLASGTYVGVTAVIMADMLGTERLTSSYGISLFVNGVLQLIGPVLCGFYIQETQGYRTLLVFLGICLIIGASLWLFVPFINRSRRRKQEHLDKIDEENEQELI